jgi:hypothetical protein
MVVAHREELLVQAADKIETVMGERPEIEQSISLGERISVWQVEGRGCFRADAQRTDEIRKKDGIASLLMSSAY